MKQTNMMKLIGVVGVTTATAFIGAGEASAIEFALDTFDENHTLQTQSSTSGSFDDTIGNTILGGTRDVTLDSLNGGGVRTRADDFGNSRLELNENSGAQGKLTLTYGSGNNFNDLDVTGDGTNNGVLFKIFGNVTASIDFTITSGATSFTETGQFTNANSNDKLFFDFSNFRDSSSNSPTTSELENVDEISLILTNNDPSASSGFDSIGFTESINSDPPQSSSTSAAVPFEAETSIAFAFLGAFGAWKYWKRRKQQQIDFDNSEA